MFFPYLLWHIICAQFWSEIWSSLVYQDKAWASKLLNSSEKQHFYREVASTAESGWDFSTRWMRLFLLIIIVFYLFCTNTHKFSLSKVLFILMWFNCQACSFNFPKFQLLRAYSILFSIAGIHQISPLCPQHQFYLLTWMYSYWGYSTLLS